MTEDQWHACKNPQSMLDFLRGKATDRKFRLLWLAMKVLAPFSPESFWKGEATFIWGERDTAEAVEQACLVRCIFGNPFHPAVIDADWLRWNVGTIVKLAQGIYDDRAFDRMSILADALEEVGCDNADILDHCRQQKEHACGCWVVDLILGKK